MPGKLVNRSRALIQRWGTRSMKKKLWDGEFTAGRWDYLDETSGDILYPILREFVNSGSILDLGCGSGNTGNEIGPMCYSDYTGVDISEIAVQKARQRSARSGRADKNNYIQADIANYAPTRRYNVILFRESLFYFRETQVRKILRRYARYLEPGGVFIVRMCDRHKYGAIVRIIERGFDVVQRHHLDGVGTIVLVFR